MKILVTGGAGFIGSHVVEKLLERKHNVIVLDNLSTGNIENINYLRDKFKTYAQNNNDNFLFLEKDISKIESFSKLGNDISMIVHLAAIVSVPQSIANPIETNSVTLGGTINIFEFAKKNGIEKIIQASSAAVYGDLKILPAREDNIGNLLSPYAIAKYSCELYADYYDKVFNIKTISLRFFNVYGDRQDPKSQYSGVISKFIDAFKNKNNINIFGDGKNTRDFIYVKDIANIIVKLVEKKVSKSAVYNLGTGKETSLLKMVKVLESVFKCKVKVNFLPKRMGDIKKSVADICKIQKAEKFKPQFTLEQGLIDMLK